MTSRSVMARQWVRVTAVADGAPGDLPRDAWWQFAAGDWAAIIARSTEHADAVAAGVLVVTELDAAECAYQDAESEAMRLRIEGRS